MARTIWSGRDPAGMGRALRGAARQIPYATSVALNETAKDIQGSVRDRMSGIFNIRRRGWFRMAVKIRPWARRSRLLTVVSIDPPGHPASRQAITRHQQTHRRRPHRGRALPVPVGARSGARGTVRANNRLDRLGLRVMSAGSWRVYRGDRRTFMLRRPDGTGLVLRRRRRGAHGSLQGTNVLWGLYRETPVEGRLEFFRTAETVYARRWGRHWTAAWERAMSTARF